MATFSLDTFKLGEGGRLPKPLVFGIFGYRWFEDVVGAFHACEDRIRISSAPARTSKSWSAFGEANWWVFPDFEVFEDRLLPMQVRENDDRRLWTVGPDYQTNKEFDYLWTTWVTQRKRWGLPYRILKKSYSPKQGNMEIVLDWGEDKFGQPVRVRIEGRSSTNPESLQGEEVDFLILSEAAEHAEKIWTRYLSTRTRFAVFPTTPKIKAEWLREMIQLGEEHDDVGISSFSFTPLCNPSYDWTRFWQEHAKAESRVVGKIETAIPKGDAAPPFEHDCFHGASCQAMRDPWFAEQFGGRWTHEADRVIPFVWDGPMSHVIHDIPPWFDIAKRYVAIDYGYTDPACVHWYAVGPDGTVLLYREIYQNRIDPQKIVHMIQEISLDAGEHIEHYCPDPQKPEVHRFMQELGLPIFCKDKKAMRDRASGHHRLVDALSIDPAIGRPKLFVLAEGVHEGYGCPRTIKEWKLLRRREGVTADEWSTAAIAGADHAYDCVRYFLSSRPTRPVRNLSSNLSYRRHREHVLWRERTKRDVDYAFTGVNPSMVEG